jgi:N-formylglutamate amidohydrolase
MTDTVFRLIRPAKQETSVVFASPHSGRDYPPAFLAASQLGTAQLRSSEDAYVDRLFARAPLYGAPLLCALVPRAYVDLNRASDELDPAVIEGLDRAAHNPRISSGLGVIPRVVASSRAIYRGKITPMDAQRRLDLYWHPYHEALQSLLNSTHDSFGEAILVDCHSMPHEAIEMHARPNQPKPDIVLGDRFGAAAAREVVDQIEAIFSSEGFRVARNAPFAGAYIAQHYGQPQSRRHVVQVEIDRSLYLDEARVEPSSRFAAMSVHMNRVVAHIARIGHRAVPMAAE